MLGFWLRIRAALTACSRWVDGRPSVQRHDHERSVRAAAKLLADFTEIRRRLETEPEFADLRGETS